MKPIKLTMRAFGPYKNEEVIDFTELKDNRLFVISGSTGAGKTTIFDGICFALYGYGSGQDRKDTKMLRSDFAEESVHTAVELVFEIHNKTYRVLRQLSHVKAGRKTATGEKYELFEIQDTQELPIVERQRVTDINQKLEEIIGLTYDQFNQIVMLPQGEFRKLLTSQSDNKEAILRKIFKTNRYGEMAQKLEEKKKKADLELQKARALKGSIVEQIIGLLPKRDSLLTAVLEKESNIHQIQKGLADEIHYYQQKIKEDEQIHSKAYSEYNEKYELFVKNKALNDRIDEFDRKVNKLNELEQQKPLYEQMNKDYEASIRANQIEPLNKQCHELNDEKRLQQARLSNVKEQLLQAQRDLEAAKQLYEKELAKQDERDAAIQHVMELQKYLPLYEQIEKQTQLVQALSKEAKNAQSNLELVDRQLSEQREQIEQLNQQIERLETKTEKINETKDEQRHLQEVVQTFTKYNEQLATSNNLQAHFDIVSKEYEEAKRIYEQEEKKWLGNQAAILAAKLVQGEPCPVCGSTEHQTLLHQTENLIDEQELDRLQGKVRQIEQKKNEAYVQVNTSSIQVKQLEETLTTLQAPIHEQAQFIQKCHEVDSLVQQLQNDLEKLSQCKKQLKQLVITSEQLADKRKQLEQIKLEKNEQFVKQQTILDQQRLAIPSDLQQLAQLQQALHLAEQTKQTLIQQWEHAQKQLQTADKLVATNEEAVKQITQQVEQLEEKLISAKEEFLTKMKAAGFESYELFQSAKRTEQEQQQLQNNFLEFTKALHSLTTQVAEERTQLKGMVKVDLTVAQEQLDQLKEVYEKALQTLNLSKDYERQAIRFSENLESVAEEINKLEEKSNQIIDLYNLLRGQNSKKISFERYVQMGYLEQITEAANIRLRNLSNGQYYLQCSDRQESHGRQSGLSLDVYDTYTGQSRDVKSLSGGEKFNASLCLALGMADVIQSFQGNVRIDTMFIDEGFGSLDEESLMKAIDTLIDLQKSGRMIGVISHVNELKAAMPAILNVEKLKEGYSRTSITVK
ncbi:AAA family ATPase [Lysinibacillus sp. BW-2-10]|uniref:AAA family ATPase n=1 Tax=Lysinibacillus sp. BW-2-10 TaxID=2590030 RepID=UPI00117D12B8|nr:SMC family ATPase [Lysinibacillus sp. BW-2-10]TSI10651.1 SMC family ATPase [Lysinibacillus sp. BW-2-10]